MRERECVGCVEGRRAGKSGGEKENKSGGKRDVLAGSDGQADMAHAYNHAPGREPFPALGGEGGGNGGHQRQRAAKPPKAIAKHVMPIFFLIFMPSIQSSDATTQTVTAFKCQGRGGACCHSHVRTLALQTSTSR
jgi:hypothetical protein